MNSEQDNPDIAALPDDAPSKSQRKRDALKAVELAKALLAMPARRRATFELPDEIDEALRLADDIRSNGAKKRQLHYVGKLLRGHSDYERIWQMHEAPAPARAAPHADNTGQQDEKMRERLLRDLSGTMDDLRTQYPQANLQLIRQLVSRIHKATSDGQIRSADNEAESAASERKISKLRQSLLEALSAGRP